MNSYLFLEYMVCHSTISEDTGFAFWIFFPVYVKNKILQVRYDTTWEVLTATTTEVKHDCLGMM